MPRFAKHPYLAAVVATLALVPAVAAQTPVPREPAAVLICLDAAGQLVVRSLDVADLSKPSPVAGLLVWAGTGSQERARFIVKGWKLEAEEPAAPDTSVALAGTRAVGISGGAVGDGIGFTVQLDQLQDTGQNRDLGDFLTPNAGGIVLSARPTIRRQGPAPAAVAILTAVVPGGPGAKATIAVRIPFKDGQRAVAFADIPNLPPALARGLARGGRYVHRLHFENKAGAVTFTVEEDAKALRVTRPLTALARLVGSKTDPLYLNFAVENLLAPDPADPDRLPRYPADALDVLDRAPAAALSPRLWQLKERLEGMLKAAKQEWKKILRPPAAPGTDTNIAELDEARALIAASRWTEAEKALDDKAFPTRLRKDRRARGLWELYRGVLYGEMGTGNEDSAEGSFRQAIALLADGPPGDLFRAHNNYAKYLRQQAQDRLYNRALQQAAGVERPFLTALQNWLVARQHYEAAHVLATKLGKADDRAAVEVNLAQLYALLADMIRTLAPPADFAGERAAARLADDYAARATRTTEPLTRAAAAEVRARLAFRAGDLAACRKFALQTQDAFLAAGYLAGVENVQRLLGLTAGPRPEKLKHFQIAHLINEAMRARLPRDAVGATQAGFFARKAWVNEQIVELLLEDGQYDEALRNNELARARALQDLLLTDHGKTDTAADDPARPMGDFLDRWPANVAAVEYFLGAKHPWVFVVGPDGKVTAHPLTTADGKRVETPRLIERVHRFLHDVEGQAGKMANRVLANKGFDHGWQDDLYSLCRELLPDAALAELRRAEVVVIVPQHILHYFPFAALVTKKDTDRGPDAMVKPTHLLDEKFTIVYAPSLTTWSLLRQQPAPAAGKVNAVGLVQAPGADPLPGVDEDLKNLRALFPKRVGVVQEGNQATVANARQLLDQPGLLFLATHGSNDADRPLDSFLILLGEGGKEGRLTARDIFEKEVHADLLVMSACYSGLGDRSPMPGDDLFGLQRAFLQSGARTVVSGLWDVYDDTAPPLMKGLFEGLAKGKSAAQALAESQRAFVNRLRASREVEPWLHPYFWAVYTAAGDHRTAMSK